VKEEYKQYLDLGLPRLRTGGVVIVDNLLWGGKVATAIPKAQRWRCENSIATSLTIRNCLPKCCRLVTGSATQ
jgi:predicted O-methyltransferase YrrM